MKLELKVMQTTRTGMRVKNKLIHHFALMVEKTELKKPRHFQSLLKSQDTKGMTAMVFQQPRADMNSVPNVALERCTRRELNHADWHNSYGSQNSVFWGAEIKYYNKLSTALKTNTLLSAFYANVFQTARSDFGDRLHSILNSTRRERRPEVVLFTCPVQ